MNFKSMKIIIGVAKHLICLTLHSMLPLNQIPSQKNLPQQVQIRPMYL